MKELDTCFIAPTDTGKVWDEQDKKLRYATLAELLEHIRECERELTILAEFYARDNELQNDTRRLELDNIVWFSKEIDLCWTLINNGKYLEVNRYGNI